MLTEPSKPSRKLLTVGKTPDREKLEGTDTAGKRRGKKEEGREGCRKKKKKGKRGKRGEERGEGGDVGEREEERGG